MKNSPTFRATARKRQAGVTLVELLVAMVIGLIVTLAVTSVISVGESHKRTTISNNDLDQSGAFAAYQLDRAIRSAGSALIQSANNGVFGCKLHVSSLLPRATPFKEPFKTNFLGGVPSDLRVAPVLIAKGGADTGSDVLVVMRGNGNAGGVPRRISDPGGATTLKLENSIGFTAGDVLLVSQSGTTDCLMEQVQTVDIGQLNLGGDLYTAGTGSTSVANLALSTSTYVTALGNASAGSVQFNLYGVGNNNTLFSYDLLEQGTGGADPQAIVDGVSELHAIYGLDTTGDGVLDSWVDPGDADYAIATMMTDPAKIRQVVALRLALVMKSSLQERDPVEPNCDGNAATAEAECANLRYFSGVVNAAGTALAGEVDTSAEANRHFRYRIVESTIPLRNMQLAPAL